MKNTGIDSERVYCTNALVTTNGRAVVISLEDATLPGSARNKHMTVLFRKKMRWSGNEIEGISRETDRWIREKYGHNKAPVTFTIHQMGPHSVRIAGDLNALCLHLRSTFASLSPDQQRAPHCELFGRNHGKGPKGHKGPKTCRMCGEIGHLQRHCPQKRNGKPQSVKPRNKNNDNLKVKLQRMIANIDELKTRKQQEIELLNEEQQRLTQLLQNEANASPSSVKQEIKMIGKLYRNKRKQLRKSNRKPRKHKVKKMGKKIGKKLDKMMAKKERNERKVQRRLEKEERKRVKKEKLQQLDAARVVSLPLHRKDICGSTLYVHVDGYNIIGCDAVCRKAMRGRGKGRQEARSRLVMLLQQQFLNALDALQLGYNIEMNVWFDGNGKNTKYNDISVVYSSRKQSVDDRLVQMLSETDKKDSNANVLVITSDKALTLRLYAIGVKVMKSGVFYKTFLKPKQADNAVMNTEDIEMNDVEMKEFESDEDFVNVITSKMVDTAGCDNDDNDDDDDDDDTEDSSDQIEGSINATDDPDDDESDDAEYATIYGEDFGSVDVEYTTMYGADFK